MDPDQPGLLASGAVTIPARVPYRPRVRYAPARRRAGAVVVLVAAGLLVPAAPAWAPHVPQLLVSPAQARAGEEVTITGTRGYGFTNPVEIHLDAPDGPLLGTFQPKGGGYAPFGPGTVVIPAGTAPGSHTIFATQELEAFEDHIRGIPARALIEVVGASSPIVPAASPTSEGASELVREGDVGALPLVLTGLGVAGSALLVGAAMAIANARRRAPEAEPTTQSG